jgi:Peptidase propeptide and YPEB domain
MTGPFMTLSIRDIMEAPMMRHIPLAALCLGVLCATQAAAQPAEPQRPALRPELAAPAEHLTQHPHSYLMSEEVARVRLQKMGYEKADTLRPVGDTAYEAEVTKDGQAQKVVVDRITGAVQTIR